MDSIIASIYGSPEKWRANEFHFMHETGVSFWIGNGFIFFVPENGIACGLIDKFRAYKAYRWWCKNAPIEALAK